MSRRKPRKDRAASTLPVHPKGRGGSRLVRRQGRRWAWLALPALLVLVVGAFALMRVGLIGSNPAAAKLPAPLREAAAKLPAPLREAPALVQEGYLYALERPDVLQYLPCFCGCWAPDHGGHTSNLSCFVKDGSLAAGRLEFEPHGSA